MRKMETITIPSGQEKIEANAYRWRRSLHSIIIPDSVTTIGKNAFYGCANLQSITIPDSVTVIESNAFNTCTDLKEVAMSSNLRSIGDLAFYWCKNLTEIVLPDSVTDIGNYAFYWCRKLTVYCSPSQKLVETYCRKNKIKLQYIDTAPEAAHPAVTDIHKEILAFISEVSMYELSIDDDVFSRELIEIREILNKIILLLEEGKDIGSRAGYLRVFVNYYFPTIKKLLDTYSRIGTQNLNVENALKTKSIIEESMPLIKRAFEKELDYMCHDKMIDIATDINVLEAMFAKDGLSDLNTV